MFLQRPLLQLLGRPARRDPRGHLLAGVPEFRDGVGEVDGQLVQGARLHGGLPAAVPLVLIGIFPRFLHDPVVVADDGDVLLARPLAPLTRVAPRSPRPIRPGRLGESNARSEMEHRYCGAGQRRPLADCPVWGGEGPLLLVILREKRFLRLDCFRNRRLGANPRLFKVTCNREAAMCICIVMSLFHRRARRASFRPYRRGPES
mmetsp:Transcript_28362/g.68125  ORF Transcript_28362/g.68125 Transcript_28362/m.68125 type:complete len:204 (-) Transcript_28362:108-719(-)